MQINTEEWLTLSEAARLLKVSHQRVHQMADDGSVEVARPWARVALVSRDSIEEWSEGVRQDRLKVTEYRSYVQAASGVDRLGTLEHGVLAAHLLSFIREARPGWSEARQAKWVREAIPKVVRA